MAIKLWLDCDPGHDDVVAILLAALDPRFQLVGISTVYGNTSLTNTTSNAGSILTALGRTDVPLHAGASEPLERPVRHAHHVHGVTGLDGSTLLPVPTVAASEVGAVEAMRAAVVAHPGLAIVATGTLTNIAILYKQHPEIKAQIGRVLIMGGGIEIGNQSPYAEFNIACDPEAALQVLTDAEMAPKTILIPLNLTHQAICTPEVRAQLYDATVPALSGTLRQMFYELMTFFTAACAEQGFTNGPPVHDPVAVYVLLSAYGEEDIGFQYRACDLTVTLEGERTGETVVVRDNAGGVRVGTGMNIPVFWDAVLKCIERAEAKRL